MGMKPLFWRCNSIYLIVNSKHPNMKTTHALLKLFKIEYLMMALYKRYIYLDKVYILRFWWCCVGSIMRWVHIQRIIQILPPAVVKSYKPLGGINLCLCRRGPWWEYWVSEFWAVLNVSEISCDPQQRSVLVYWYTSSKTGYVSTQQSTAFLEEVFGRSFLAGLPHRGVRFFQQVLIWTHYACTNMTPVHVVQRNANLVAERQLVIPRVKPEKPTSSE